MLRCLIPTLHSNPVPHPHPPPITPPPLPNTLAFDILVVDEAQDMTHVYFMLLHKFIQDCGRKFQLLVLGDKKQGLYEFKGADIRFLTLAHSCWHNHPLLKTQTFNPLYITYLLPYYQTHGRFRQYRFVG